MKRVVGASLHHQDELRVGLALDPKDSLIRHEAGLFRRVDRLVADEVPARREAELGYEPFLGDDVAFVKLALLDLDLAFAELPADQVRVCRGDEGLFPLVVHLHPDGHRRGAATTVRRAYTWLSRRRKSRLLWPSV